MYKLLLLDRKQKNYNLYFLNLMIIVSTAQAAIKANNN